MTNYLTMSRDEFRDEVRIASKTLAFMDFQRKNPTATDDQAHSHAERFWQNYTVMALDFLAALQVDAEAEAAEAKAAPWN